MSVRVETAGPSGEQRLDDREIYFDSECSSQRFNRDDNSVLILEPSEDALNAFKRPLPDADPFAILQKRMWGNLCRPADRSLDRVDVGLGDRACASSAFYKLKHACGA